MRISKTFAQDVVVEMKKIINQDINYIDVDGKIIASTDVNRIGDFHEAAVEVSKSRKKVVIEYDGQFLGAKKGINLPVYFHNEIIGVIGITGDKDKVEKFGEIIKRMTEILIVEASLKEAKNREIQYEKMILEGILFNEDFSEEAIIHYGDIYKYNDQYNGMVIVSKAMDHDDYNIQMKETILDVYRSYIHKETDLIMEHNHFIVMLLLGYDCKRSRNIIKNIHNELTNKYNTNAKFGVGLKKNTLKTMKDSYYEAMNALHWVLSDKEKDILFYEDMELELILNKVDKKTKNNFIKKVLKNLTELEVQEYQEILQAYEKYNGSITKISSNLFLHKNTLQYKLDKLYKKTGFNMRRYKDFTILKVAFMLLKKESSI